MIGLLANAKVPENWFLPESASTIAPTIDWLQYFILWVCIVFGVLVLGLTLAIAIRFRHRPGINDRATGPTHSTLLEIVWTVIPAVIVLLIAIWGFQAYMQATVVPQTALEIEVEGFKWGWRFTYPNGYTDDQLHIPKDIPVRLVLSSNDVIHSLYFRHFRLKKDVVPGRYNKLWVVATETSPLPEGLNRQVNASYSKEEQAAAEKAGEEFGFDIFCAEYCGTNHSQMRSKVHVHDTVESYEAWLADAGNWEKRFSDNWIEAGRNLANKNSCVQCHSHDDGDPNSPKTGPSWVNMFGKTERFTDGSSRVVDEDYIRESIRNPSKLIVEGYGSSMAPYLNLSDREITAIIRYMKSLSKFYTGSKEELKKPLPKDGKASDNEAGGTPDDSKEKDKPADPQPQATAQ